MPDIDLTGAGASASTPRIGGRSGAGQGPTSTATGTRAKEAAERALKGDLEGVFGRLADILEARGDEELSTIFSEDKEVLSQGLMSATEALTPLRRPLVVVIHLVEPVLAFGRLIGVLARRVRERFLVVEEEPGAPTPQV